MQSFVEIGNAVLGKNISKFYVSSLFFRPVNVFSLCCKYVPLEKGMACANDWLKSVLCS